MAAVACFAPPSAIDFVAGRGVKGTHVVASPRLLAHCSAASGQGVEQASQAQHDLVLFALSARTAAKKRYKVLGKWAQSLWAERKLSHAVYEEYIFLSRDGVSGRKRNLDLVVEWEKAKRRKEEIKERKERIQNNKDLFPGFPTVPAAEAWLKTFKKDAVRYPILIVLGKSHTGKTEWANSLFKNALELEIGGLTHFPEKMREYDEDKHDALILDDLRDLHFLREHQEKIQGNYRKEVEFASTQGGTCAFSRNLWAVPVVATCNYDTKNLQYLETDDWLSKKENRVVVHWPPSEA